MHYKLFAGIDISKDSVDVVILVVDTPDQYNHQSFSNDYAGFDQMLKWIDSTTSVSLKDILFCCEHTGLYTNPLCTWMTGKEGQLCVENALQIKRSIGLKRGKSDKADAYAIARYAFTNKHQVRLYQQPPATITRIKHLLGYREQLVRHQVSFKSAVSELKAFDKTNAAFCIDESDEWIKLYAKKIKEVDEQLNTVIQNDPELSNQFELVRSVYGIGKQTAFFILIHTQAFTAFSDYRKFACYCGIAPFEYSSGSSIRGRTRISSLANKKLKSLLTMCALNTVKVDNEFQRYYLRKKAEGKSTLCVMNVIKNKLISRVFAAVRNGRPYQPEILLT